MRCGSSTVRTGITPSRLIAYCLLFSVYAFVATTLLCAQDRPSTGKLVQEPPPFNARMLDPQINPCDDFYAYSCAKWLAANPIPPDQASWSRFHELAERNRLILRGILEKASSPDPQRSPVMQKIGGYYASCMDEATIDAKGLAPLQPELKRIAKLKNQAKLADELGHLQRIGVNAAFRFSSDQDFKDATQVIAEADQGGLGLPERDYYFRDDQKSRELRQAYGAHVQKMLELLGEAPPKAAADAQIVLQIETALAKASLGVVARRDPVNVYHKMSVDELANLAPAFAWNRYLKAVDAPPIQTLNVAVPDFFKGMQAVIESQPIEHWKAYLRWHLVHASAPMLPRAFVEENFNFYGKTLTGTKEVQPRWKRCVRSTDSALGEALGQPYVEETFGPDGKRRTLQMVRAVEKALHQDILQLNWMTDATKQQALLKLGKVGNKIGYPDHWRDYSKLKIVRGDALGNRFRAGQFEFNRQLAKIGKPVNRGEWDMTPPTVNAYYNPQMNDINFPAGILQPPFFDKRLDDAINFGAIGGVIGHELTHGFDDQGRQFDAEGNLRNWWTPEDLRQFEKRTQCLVDEYSQFTAVDDIHLNGKLTLGENTADNGGLRLALIALEDELRGHEVQPIEGFTPVQRLFLGWGQVWCENATDEVLRMLAHTDAHSVPRYRVNGVVSNMPEFQQAFGCKPGQPMVRQNACRVW
jgi:endothelin-converting enzyme/putative endopeptidase